MTPSELARLVDLRFARRIRERRRTIGMTQRKLAQIIGGAFQQAHKYERGLSRVSAGRFYFFAPEEEGADSDGRPRNGD